MSMKNKKLFFYCFLDALSPLADNDTAAWRGGGFQREMIDTTALISPLPVVNSFCRRLAKPQVVGRLLCSLLKITITTLVVFKHLYFKFQK
jgi:hypothetical protein